MYQNWLAIGIAALIPMIIGMIWYHPKVFGTAWMKSVGLKPEDAESVNMPLMVGLTLLFGMMLSVMLSVVVVHQNGLISLLIMDPDFATAGSEISNYVQNFKDSYGMTHRTFGHGALHGAILAMLTSVPFIGSLAFHEKRSIKYVLIHCGYWIFTSILMGGLISAWV